MITLLAGQTQAFVSVNGYSASTFNMTVVVGGSIPSTYVFNANAAKLYKAMLAMVRIAPSAVPPEQS